MKSGAAAFAIMVAMMLPATSRADNDWPDWFGDAYPSVDAAWVSWLSTIMAMLNQTKPLEISAWLTHALQISGEREKLAIIRAKTEDAKNAWKVEHEMGNGVSQIGRDFSPPVDKCSGTAGRSLTSVGSRADASAARMSRAFVNNKMSGQTPYIAAIELAAAHQEFCSEDDVARGRCSAAAIDGTEMADVNAASFFSPTDENAFSAKEQRAAAAFIRRVTDPEPAMQVPQPWQQGGNGRAYEGMMMADGAALSLANYSLTRIQSSRLRP